MAITKIKAIKSTLDKAISYICNPEKTDGGLLVDSYRCVPEFVAQQMEATEKECKTRGNRHAYHLMQSFSPDDNITPEQALEIGKSFANQVTGGKHEYVIAVHTDQDHIHCHIIFNATNYKDGNKYRYSGVAERDRIRDISDKLCRDNGLSVIERFSGKRGKGWYAYDKNKKAPLRQKLKEAIDKAIAASGNFEEFVELMELEGYIFKQGKHIAFIMETENGPKTIRCKSIGDYYTEEIIRDRISNKEKYKDIDLSGKVDNGQNTKNEQQRKNSKGNKSNNFKHGNINLITDLTNNMKAQNSPGYKYVVEKSNLNSLVKTMNFLSKHDAETPEQFREFYDKCKNEVIDINKNIQRHNLQITKLFEKKDYIKKYYANKKYYYTFMKYSTNTNYFKKHEKEIREFEMAKAWLERNKVDIKAYSHDDFEKEYNRLRDEKSALGEKLKSAKTALHDADNVMTNIETALGINLYEKSADESASKDESASAHAQQTDKNKYERQ